MPTTTAASSAVAVGVLGRVDDRVNHRIHAVLLPGLRVLPLPVRIGLAAEDVPIEPRGRAFVRHRLARFRLAESLRVLLRGREVANDLAHRHPATGELLLPVLRAGIGRALQDVSIQFRNDPVCIRSAWLLGRRHRGEKRERNECAHHYTPHLGILLLCFLFRIGAGSPVAVAESVWSGRARSRFMGKAPRCRRREWSRSAAPQRQDICPGAPP